MQLENVGNFIIKKLNDELPKYLTYHNADHTKDVHEAARYIGELENITGDDMKLLLTAAWFHDSGYLTRMQGHEEESCRIAGNTLPGYGYTIHEIEKICGMIMATQLPQSPKNHLEQILADADLDYLGRDDFFVISDKLFLENSLTGTIGNKSEWDQKQILFLENHCYFTISAINLRQAKKEANLGQIKAQVNSGIK